MRVLKFGGSSVADDACIERVTQLVAAERAAGPVAVVASAMAGVTDLLVAAVGRAAGVPSDVVGRLRRRHRDCLEAVAPADGLARRQLDNRLRRLQRQLKSLAASGISSAVRDAVLASGEHLLVPVLAAALRAVGVPAMVVDARRLIATDSRFGAAEVDLQRTRRRAQRALAGWPREVVPVIPGYSGADPRGRATTLGRGGSDTSAAVLGVALGAAVVEIWSDVDGVLSAPPKAVPEAHVVTHLDYAEAEEIARHGGKVLHEKTVAPCARAGIPIAVRNTFRPGEPGTLIGGEPARSGRVVCVTGCDTGEKTAGDWAVLAVVGKGVACLPGVATRVCTVLAAEGITVKEVGKEGSSAALRVLVEVRRLGDALRAVHRTLVQPGAQGAAPLRGQGECDGRGEGNWAEPRLLEEVCHG